jgi:hypothetical protein
VTRSPTSSRFPWPSTIAISPSVRPDSRIRGLACRSEGRRLPAVSGGHIHFLLGGVGTFNQKLQGQPATHHSNLATELVFASTSRMFAEPLKQESLLLLISTQCFDRRMQQRRVVSFHTSQQGPADLIQEWALN